MLTAVLVGDRMATASADDVGIIRLGWRCARATFPCAAE